ncbi:MAG: glycoside hydrolase family 5 protein [Clostridiales bacterium]|jgi:hypothetical protein|nr:glycoside hydrolase family 5 protein [Clostridiales bacterium]
MIRAELGRERVDGFLDTRGTKIVNGAGEEVLLAGWGLGNWLLCEGYMWLSGGAERFDRPRRIERVICELCGAEYARNFWRTFRDRYITEDDIRLMAELGYNSVRIPINARLFLSEGPGLNWDETGFALLDRCIDWCEKHRLYAFIDLHGAPGGQTGANIDDSLDDVPRLFLDQDCFDKGVALWKKLAQRYKDRWIVGGYDLLNEPLRPERVGYGGGVGGGEADAAAPDRNRDTAYLLPRLVEFYEAAIREIRAVDERHLITLEGHHWATGTEVFCKKYDPKTVIHFHRYACLPDVEAFAPYLALRERWESPLWLGETGENDIEWFTAMYPLAAELGIGFNVWPWKKMRCVNSPCSVAPPEGWERLIEYARGGAHPGYEAARGALDAYLDAILLQNCAVNEEVTQAVFRRPGCTIRGTDFDELPGPGVSYLSRSDEEHLYHYRRATRMRIIEKTQDKPRSFSFDCGWKRFVLGLAEGEFAVYTLCDVTMLSRAEIHCYSAASATLNVSQDGEPLGSFTLGGVGDIQVIGSLKLRAAARTQLRLEVTSGAVEIDSIHTSGGESIVGNQYSPRANHE